MDQPHIPKLRFQGKVRVTSVPRRVTSVPRIRTSGLWDLNLPVVAKQSNSNERQAGAGPWTCGIEFPPRNSACPLAPRMTFKSPSVMPARHAIRYVPGVDRDTWYSVKVLQGHSS